MPTAPANHNPLSRGTMQRRERDRGTAAERGYGYKWQKVRAAFLAQCGHQCSVRGCTEQATIVDHIEPHRGDINKFWDASNWQAMCKHHHDAKTARGA